MADNREMASRLDSEKAGEELATRLKEYIEASDGQFLREENGALHIILGDKRIPLHASCDNYALAQLMLTVCNITLLSQAAKVAVQRLQVEARQAAGQLQFRRFSACSDDRSRLYVPVKDGQLLRVTAAGVMEVANGDNEDHIWLEHPYADPLRYEPSSGGLEHFERLLVETQACTAPAMRWLVAMHLGLFPYVREFCSARFILESIGPRQSGKTTGAGRFTLLHGLGEVKGDFSVAALGNLGDVGLLVMDNKEQANFSQPLIDFCLFLATGAERGRSYPDGTLRPPQYGRPAAVITTIEGVVKAELQARCVEVQYEVPGQRLQRGLTEREITLRRHVIGSALVRVLPHFLRIADDPWETPNPVPGFQEHFTVLCNLLRACGMESHKPARWSECIIAEWNRIIVGAEVDDDDLEHPLGRVLREFKSAFPEPRRLRLGNQWGTLYVTTAAELLTLLQKLNLRELPLPKNAPGLTRRLNSSRFQAFKYLKTNTPGIPELARRAMRKPIGLFEPEDDALTTNDGSTPGGRHRLNLS